MPKLIGFDAGLRTGFAVVEPKKPPVTGSKAIPGSAAELGLLCHAFGHFVRDMIEEHKPDGIVLCKPWIGGFSVKKKKGGFRVAQDISATEILFGMYGMAKAVAYAAHIPVYDLHESQVRDAFGVRSDRSIKNKDKRRKDLKAKVEAACAACGWHVCDDHAGDALLAAAYQLGSMVPKVAVEANTPLFAAAPKKKRRRKK